MVFFYYLIDGFDFYKTFFAERPYHHDYQNIKPGGIRGHGLGVIGTIMMILLLFYSLRKRFKIFNKLGAINRWLDVHILLGIMGPLFVILHTSFKLNGIVAVSFWSMIAVALSGILGRYLYLQIPRNIRGDELSFEDTEKIDRELTQKIISIYSLNEKSLSKIQNSILGDVNPNKSLLGILFSLFIADFIKINRYRRIRKALIKIVKISPSQAEELIEIARQKAILSRRIVLWNKIHDLFHYWHVIHKPFALIMYLIMIIHVAITVILGYRWVF
jgi:hypothetical protein